MRKKVSLMICLLMTLTLILTGVQPVSAKVIISQTVTLNQLVGNQIGLKQKESIQIKGAYKSCTSKNEKIVTITKTGILTGKRKGSTTVTLKTSGKSYTLKVTVGTITKAITGLTDTYSVKNGETLQLSPATNPTKPSVAGFTYTSMNKKIATVNAKGMVTANKEGTVKIKICSKDNRCTKAVSLTVTKGTTKYEYDSYQDLYDSLNSTKDKGLFLRTDTALVIDGKTIIGYQDENAMVSFELYNEGNNPRMVVWINGSGNMIMTIFNGKVDILSPSIFQYFRSFCAMNQNADPSELHIKSSMFEQLMQGNYINNEQDCYFSAGAYTKLYIDDELVVSDDETAYYNSKYGSVDLEFWEDSTGTRKCNFYTKQLCFIKEYSVNGMNINFFEYNGL